MTVLFWALGMIVWIAVGSFWLIALIDWRIRKARNNVRIR